MCRAIFAICLLGILLTAIARPLGAVTLELSNREQRSTVALDGSFSPAQNRLLEQWLYNSLDAVGRVYGEWPKDRLQIRVMPMDPNRHRLGGWFTQFSTSIRAAPETISPVPWGTVTRGNGGSPDTVSLAVNIKRDAEAFTRDWTIYHELSHLLIPYRSGGQWFSEGLASYYQNLVQARAGLLDEGQMWTKLCAGFERGRKQDQFSHLELSELSSDMRAHRAFMRVYWSGALYWLELDVHLRQRKGSSLDTALLKLKRCCSERPMSARAIARRLDQLSDTSAFSDKFRQYRHTRAIPDYEALLKRLGVDTGRGDLQLIDDAPLSGLRHAIYAG